MERQPKGKRARLDVPLGTTLRPRGPFPSHLFQDLNLNCESREGFGSADSMVISELIQTCCLYKEYDSNLGFLLLFFFFMKMRELPHALNFIEFYRHG